MTPEASTEVKNAIDRGHLTRRARGNNRGKVSSATVGRLAEELRVVRGALVGIGHYFPRLIRAWIVI
jgi:hypothetical protein